MRVRIFNGHELEEQRISYQDVAAKIAQRASQVGFVLSFSVEYCTLTCSKVRRAVGDFDPIRGKKTKYLRPKDWVKVFDLINDVLDEHEVEAIAETGLYRFRIGLHRRLTFDDQMHRFSNLFEFRHKPEHRFGVSGDYAKSPRTALVETRGMKLETMVEIRVED